MAFADLKNDFIFRRIFETHPDLLCSLLDDLLKRTGEQTIEEIEYLPSLHLPLAAWAKLSLLGVRCKDRAGTTFVVEIQLIHLAGFINRAVYSACKAYVGELQQASTDVIAISICNFELWPDDQQRAQNLPLVPMLSRWNMTERNSDSGELLQVQYVFLELPKLPARRPETPGAELWAWLFVHAPELTEIPADLAPGAYRATLELANMATFTQLGLDAYRRAIDEIQQAEELGEARWTEGFAQGKAKAKAKAMAKGMAEALLAFLAARGIAVSADARARIEASKDPATLEQWIARAVHVASVEEIFTSPA